PPLFFSHRYCAPRYLPSFPTRRSSDLATAQRRDGGRKPRVLPLGEAMPLDPDQLDTDREVVTTRAPEQARDAGMPGAIVAGHELDQLAAPPDEQVRRDTYPLELGERRMGPHVEAIAEECLDRAKAEAARRQADEMDDHGVDRRGGPAVVVRRRTAARPREPARRVRVESARAHA